MAERVGFEPTVPLRAQRFSRPSRSATLAPLRCSSCLIGGEGGIRTHGRVSPTHAFQACSLSHSDTSPFTAVFSKNPWRGAEPARSPAHPLYSFRFPFCGTASRAARRRTLSTARSTPRPAPPLRLRGGDSAAGDARDRRARPASRRNHPSGPPRRTRPAAAAPMRAAGRRPKWQRTTCRKPTG